MSIRKLKYNMISSKRIIQQHYYCAEHKTEKNSLIFVCKDERCHSLICSLCKTEKHRGHNVVEVDQLVKEAEICRYDQ